MDPLPTGNLGLQSVIAAKAGQRNQPRGSRICFHKQLRAETLGSRQVLDAGGQANPGVHAFFIDRHAWRREPWLRKRPDGDGYDARHFIDDVVHRGSAGGTKPEPRVRPFIADAHVLACGA